MRLGYYTDYSEETAEFADGYRLHLAGALRLAGFRHQPRHRHSRGGSMRSLPTYSSRDLEISALGYYPNYLTCRLPKSVPNAAAISSPCSTSRSA